MENAGGYHSIRVHLVTCETLASGQIDPAELLGSQFHGCFPNPAGLSLVKPHQIGALRSLHGSYGCALLAGKEQGSVCSTIHKKKQGFLKIGGYLHLDEKPILR